MSTNGAYPLAGINPYVNVDQPGSILPAAWPVTDPNRYPVVNTVSGAPFMAD